MKPSFIIHTDSLTILDKLTTEQKGILFDAIYKYHLGELVELDPLMDIVFTPFKNQFDRDWVKYKKVVDRNRLNGLKGGRPKDVDNQDIDNNPEEPTETQQNPSGFTETQTNPENLDSDNDNVNDNESDSVNDSKKESDLESSDKPNHVLPESIKRIPKQQKEKIDFDALLNFFNHTFQKKCTVFDKTIQDKYNALIKKGYTKEDIASAMLNASKDPFHVENGYKHMTLEFFSRSVKIDKFANISNVKPKEPKKELPANVGGGSMLKAL